MNWKMCVSQILGQMGYQIKKKDGFDPAMEEEFRMIFNQCKGLHLQSVERLYALYQALEYIAKYQIEGDIVECGVYKGATAIFAAHFFLRKKEVTRQIYLYDTYEGWPDREDMDRPVASTQKNQIEKGRWNEGLGVSLEAVRKNVWETGYAKEKFIFVKGKVEDTLPATMPQKIALLRLDTDWYESTYHELVHLFPRLCLNGVLILDDYGHWQGAKDAADQYFKEQGKPMLLHRIDYTGRIGIKTA